MGTPLFESIPIYVLNEHVQDDGRLHTPAAFYDMGLGFLSLWSQV
ncbi:hypothetical protein PVOR_00115 [Paenibacillus vortex V453]|uniref:Uncharacterized protein n=1 Tax=Paenibacillus vortex V453 TaxID=715225 RepID=A0A2R9T200_9BACL|nr:hypothetical protein PVOR_00115 [Paenibacillus vortex V453]